MDFTTYDFWNTRSIETEKALGFNLAYDLRLSDFVSAKFKFGNKKERKNDPLTSIMNMDLWGELQVRIPKEMD